MTDRNGTEDLWQLGAQVRPLEGGRSGETFLVQAADHQGVIRFYGRQPDRAAVDHSLLRLVHGLLPVPQVLQARTGHAGPSDVNRTDAPPYLLCERLPGVRLDLLLADPDTSERVRRTAGGHLGELLARLSAIPFLRAGEFAGPDLAVHAFRDAGLEQWVAERRNRGGLAALSDQQIDALSEVAGRGQALLDGCSRVCLCHYDMTTTNILVEPGSGRVTGLIDWERAHAGRPHTDLGNVLRFETDEVFCHAVLRSYADRAPNVRADFLDRARAADLFALVDLVADENAEGQQAARAADLLGRIAATGDLGGDRPAWV